MTAPTSARTPGAAYRERIGQALASGDAREALRQARAYWQADRGPGTARHLVAQLDRLFPEGRIVEHRVAFLRSFTVEPLVPYLQAEAALDGCRLQPWVGGFNVYAQEILDPASGLYAHRPHTIVLAVQCRDIAPRLWEGFPGLSEAEAEEEGRLAARTLADLLTTLRARSDAHILVHGLATPARPAAGLFDAQRAHGQVAAIQALNAQLRAHCNALRDVHWLDYDALEARHGKLRWFDEKKWLAARLPFSVEAMEQMAAEWWRCLTPLALPAAKVVVLDLDNTLWGGTVGEDGMAGIRMGQEAPGVHHRKLQQALLDIARRGVLLAVCSKNNEADALAVLRDHPDMLLRPKDFAAMRINWQAKADNLLELARELNLGLDAFVFVDDNPFEREEVARALPAVHVLDLPADPAGYADCLRGVATLERYALSQEDAARGRYYGEERERRELLGRAENVEDYLRSLGIRVRIEAVSEASLPRAAQLTQKTNQLNMTTRRYSESDIAGMLARDGARAYVLSAADRLGDNGIVGVAIVRARGEVHEIDAFLLSCRVIGRGIETAFLHFLCEQSAGTGAGELGGWFIPTAKNAPAAAIYEKAGFTPGRREGDAVWWGMRLPEGRVPMPDWIAFA
ncbi:MAG: HAD-IIIC family phosphatase [Pseudomonadota bacterium]